MRQKNASFLLNPSSRFIVCLNGLLEPFIYEIDHFTKTGSGQTRGTLPTPSMFVPSLSWQNDRFIYNDAICCTPKKGVFRTEYELHLQLWRERRHPSPTFTFTTSPTFCVVPCPSCSCHRCRFERRGQWRFREQEQCARSACPGKTKRRLISNIECFIFVMRSD